MNKEHLESASTPEEAGETAPDKKPMSETEMLQLMAEKTECSYSATRYRTIPQKLSTTITYRIIYFVAPR